MNEKQLEPLITRISIHDGTELIIYNRESFEVLNVERQTWDNSQFIEIGQTIQIEGTKYRVLKINFKLHEKMYQSPPEGMGTNRLSSTHPSEYNCEIGVFVEKLS